MNDDKLIWREHTRRDLLTTPIFSVSEAECEAADGKRGVFSLVASKSWALVIPVLETERGREFVMVRQWRHGSRSLSVEFPGGVIEEGEAIEAGIKRELREETGYSAQAWTLLARMNPNPAFMENTMSFYLAEDLRLEGAQHLDEDERVNVELHPIDEVLRAMGTPPYIHTFMAAALHFYRQRYCNAPQSR